MSTSVKCGNAQHPRGPWHEASPIPPSWAWRARLRYWLNQRRHGCGCDR